MGVQRRVDFDVQNAVNETGFGKFNLRLLAVCGLIFMNTGFGIGNIGLIVPAAACDFEMSTVDKGRLTAASMLGMVCGSYFWGCLAEMRGRKVGLLAALFIDGCAGFLSSIINNFWVFLFLKFLNGFAISGQIGMVFPYLGEFQPTRVREKILCWMEMAWTVGLIILPLVGWGIIPLTFEYRTTYISFRSWNLFCLICSLFPMIIGTWLLFFPESPMYLIEDGQELKALRILAGMYAENTGKPAETYSTFCMKTDDVSLSDVMKLARGEAGNGSEKPERKKKSLMKMLRDICMQTATILRPPYLKKTAIACAIQFGVTSSYYTLTLWFPEVFQRFAEFEEKYPGESASVCTVSQVVTPINGTIEDSDPHNCENVVQTSVYVYTVFLGLACIPASILLPLTINRLGYRFFMVSSTLISSAISVALFFVTSSFQNIILSCIFEALTSLCISVGFCILVDLFPTNLRVIAAALSSLCSRSGALFANLMFGYLIDIHCAVPIAVVAAQLLLSGVLCFFVPGKQEMAAIISAISAKPSA